MGWAGALDQQMWKVFTQMAHAVLCCYTITQRMWLTQAGVLAFVLCIISVLADVDLIPPPLLLLLLLVSLQTTAQFEEEVAAIPTAAADAYNPFEQPYSAGDAQHPSWQQAAALDRLACRQCANIQASAMLEVCPAKFLQQHRLPTALLAQAVHIRCYSAALLF
jgi:hypothetical protein